MYKFLAFGEFLKLLLSVLDIKYSKLARSINVDPSLVNKWIHGERIPPYRSDYVGKIADLISMNILNMFQEKKIIEILNLTNIEFDTAMKVSEKIKKSLWESLGYSEEARNMGKGHYIKALNTKLQFNNRLLPSHNLGGQHRKTRAGGMDAPNIRRYKLTGRVSDSSVIKLSPSDRIITGRENILETGLHLLKRAAKIPPHKDDSSIYLTFMDDELFSNIEEDFMSRYRNSLCNALKNNWSIVLIFQISNDTNRIMRFLRLASSLFPLGKLYIYYLTKYDVLSYGNQILIVPGIGVLSCYSTGSRAEVDNAFCLTCAAAVDIFTRHLNKTVMEV